MRRQSKGWQQKAEFGRIIAKNIAFTKFLAIAGAVLVWFPLLAPVLFWIPRLVRGGMFIFRFDYLIPAELFPFTLLGGV
jgi:hypothetical protein